MALWAFKRIFALGQFGIGPRKTMMAFGAHKWNAFPFRALLNLFGEFPYLVTKAQKIPSKNKIQKERMKMEEKKTVEKTGLPILINGVELTGKDLQCIAIHLRFCMSIICSDDLKKIETSFPCQFCADEEPATVFCPYYDLPAVLGKLEAITGLVI